MQYKGQLVRRSYYTAGCTVGEVAHVEYKTLLVDRLLYCQSGLQVALSRGSREADIPLPLMFILKGEC